MTPRLHHQEARKILIGLVTIAIGGVIAYVGTLVQGGGALPFSSYTQVSAMFRDVGTLKPQQNVTENGIRVGVVTGVHYVNGAAEVTMRLDGNQTLYSDATAAVGNASVLGRKFVSLDPGTPSTGLLGGRSIPVTQTTSSSDLNTVLASFTPAARQGLQTALKNLGGGMSGYGPELYSVVQVASPLVSDAKTILGTVASSQANLPALLSSADQLVTSLHGHESQISSLLTELNLTLQSIDVGNTASLRQVIADAPSTLETVRSGLAAINPALVDTANAATALQPGLIDLAAATPNLRGFLREAPPVAVTVRNFATSAAAPVGSLIPAVTALQPVVGHLQETLGYTGPALSVLAPFAPDAGTLFCENDLLSGNFGPTKHYFAAMLVFPGIYNVSLPDPLAQMDPYPGAGNAFREGLDYGKTKCS